MEIIGHRGASFDAPENTVASALLAWQQGADAVEFDLHRTADEQLIVIHDRTTKRTTGRAGRVAGMSFDALRKLDAGSWKGVRFSGEQLPGVEEMLATVPAGKRVFIELKCDAVCLPVLAKILGSSELEPARVSLMSFDFETIEATKRVLSAHPALWLFDVGFGQRRPPLAKIIARCRAAGLDGLDLAGGWPMDEAFVRQIHDAGLKLYAWTVDDAVLARKLAALGFDGITTNRPGWLREQLGNYFSEGDQ